MTSSRRHHLKVTFNNQDFNVAVSLSDVKTDIYLLCVIVKIVALSKIKLQSLGVLVLQSLMLQIAANWIEQETADIAAAKEAHMAENCATPDLSGDQAALMVKTHKSNFALSPTERRGARAHVSFHVNRTSARSCTSPSTRSMRTDTTPRPKWPRQTKRYTDAVM